MTEVLLDRIPYARFLGLEAVRDGDDLLVTMPFADHLIGNPLLPALHGGSTAALLELTATARAAIAFPTLRQPRPINVTVSYLRSGRPEPVYCRARILRAGKRVAHVVAEAWQDDPDQPIASLTANFLLDETD